MTNGTYYYGFVASILNGIPEFNKAFSQTVNVVTPVLQEWFFKDRSIDASASENLSSKSESEFEKLVECLPKLASATYPFDLLAIRQKDNQQTLRYLFAINSMSFLQNQNILNKAKKYIAGFDQLFWNQQFPMVVETVMTILYYENQILDRKYGVVTHEKIAANLLGLSMLKEGLYKYVDTNVASKYQKPLKSFISRVVTAVDAGQWLQPEMNTYKQWRDNEIKPLNLNDIIDGHYQSQMGIAIETILVELRTLMPDFVAAKENYLKNYLTRIYLTNSIFFLEILDFQLKFVHLKQRKREKLEKAIGIFGIIHQLVNDVADFIPNSKVKISNTKIAEDHLKDVENEIITLAVATHLYRSPNGELDSYLKSKEKRLNKVKVMTEFERSLAPYYIWKFTSGLIEQVQEELSQFKNKDKKLLDMLMVGKENKYYTYFRNKTVLWERFKVDKRIVKNNHNKVLSSTCKN